MSLFRITSIVVCLAVLLGLPWEASAQPSRPERPYRGLFGGGESGGEQSLNVNGSIGGGWDDNILLDIPGAGPGTVDPRLQRAGVVGSFDGSVAYSLNKPRGSFNASAGGSTRYYPNQENITFASYYGGGVGGSTKIGERSNLSGNYYIGYQPFTFTSAFPAMFPPAPGLLPDVTLDLATSADAYLTQTGTIAFGQQLSQRTTFSASYTRQQSDTAYVGNNDFSSQAASAGIRYAWTRGLGVRLGYSYNEGRYSQRPDPVKGQYIDAGIDYNKALSFSRRTSLAFSTGTSAVNYGGSNTTYQAIGSARLTHEMGRTWLAYAGYNRSFQFVDTLLQPVLYDSFGGGVNGLLNRRVEASAGFYAAVGALGPGNSLNSNAFDTYQASATMNVSLTRYMQFGTSYSYFRYRFDQTILLPPGVVQSIGRNSYRAYVTLWAPLISQRRS